MAAWNPISTRTHRHLLGILCAWAVMAGGPIGMLPASPPSELLPRPEWIWTLDEDHGDQPVLLQTVVNVPIQVRQARVEMIADFADVELQINGQPAGRCEPYQAVSEWDVTACLETGENRLAISAEGTGGPAAVALRLTWHDKDDQSHWLVTDARWRTRTGPAKSSGHVGRVLWEGDRGPVPLSRLEDYTQWERALKPGQVTDPSTFVAPPDFEVQLLHTAGADEGSWVAMAFDPEGRLTIAREQQGLLRLSLSSDRQQIRTVERLDDRLRECRGLLYSGGHLYANANNDQALFRLSDTTGDGRFDQTVQLYAAEGGVGHGRNDLALGPDGQLYVIHGDSVDLPQDFADRTSPAREQRRGEATREGHLLRISREGGPGVIWAAGLRNPFGVAFNRDGEAFTYDADAEYDMGAPWYRPTRVYQLFAGADFGWRGVTGNWPPYYPDHCDNAPPVLEVGRGSPTAVKFATGSHFPPPYDDALFILDWAYGRVMAVQMEPRGSSYACLGETFLQGRPLNVTDLEFGPDGAMYLITGGRKTQSALYRVQYRGPSSGELVATPQQQARRQHAMLARAHRQRLEKLLGQASAEALEAVWPAIAEADPGLRYVARTVVEHQPLERWATRALQEDRYPHSVMALLALARCDASRYGAEVAQRLAGLPLESLAPREQMVALYTGWLCLEHPDAAAVHAALQTLLDGRYPSQAGSSPHQQQWNLWASRILVRIAPDRAVPATMELLRRSDADPRQQLHYLFVLRSARTGWTDSLRRLYFRRLRDAELFEGGAGMPEFLTRIRNEAVETLGDAERTSLAALLEAEDRPLQPIGPPRPLVRRWTLQELETLLAESELTEEESMAASGRGERLFAEAACATCHRFADQGRPLGPDLTYVARRFSPGDLLKAIVKPSEVVAEEYRNVQIVTQGGQVHIGRVLRAGDFREPTLRLLSDPGDPQRVTEIDKREIAESRQSSISPMPDGLLDVLTADEVLDLLAYLRSAKPSSLAR